MKPQNNLSSLENLIGYNFKDKELLDIALTHRSYLNESKSTTSNERLEFLGDAVLELVISEYLYELKPNEPEGVLTAARSAIVRTESLAEIAKKLDLGLYLKMSYGEEKTGGRTNQSLLANTTESIIGAIYLDGGYQNVLEFSKTHIFPEAKTILTLTPLKDPKSLLQEKVQDKGYSSPIYKTISETGPDHDKIFQVGVYLENQQLSVGTGSNKQKAQQNAAEKALQNIKKLAPIS